MSKLEFILEDLLAAADKAAPQTVKIRLSNGLTLNLRKVEGQYILILWRVGVYPDMREWNTVCAHWPYPVSAPVCHRGRYEGRFYLQGRLPAHPKTTMVGQTFM